MARAFWKFILLAVFSLVIAEAARAQQPADGIYVMQQTGSGAKMKRNDFWREIRSPI